MLKNLAYQLETLFFLTVPQPLLHNLCDFINILPGFHVLGVFSLSTCHAIHLQEPIYLGKEQHYSYYWLCIGMTSLSLSTTHTLVVVS